MVKRGDIYHVVPPRDFGKQRPAVVVQSPLFLANAPTVTFCLMTGSVQFVNPMRILVKPTKRNGLCYRAAGRWLRCQHHLGDAGRHRRHYSDDQYARIKRGRKSGSQPRGPASPHLKTPCCLWDRLRANSGIGGHGGSNCQKTWLDFRVASKRYSSTNNATIPVDLFGIDGQQRRGLNGSLNSSAAEKEKQYCSVPQ
jgi:hypothetical protein